MGPWAYRLLLGWLCLGWIAACRPAEEGIKSPDGRLEVRVAVVEGVVYYQIFRDGQPVLEPSRLGLLRSDGDFRQNLQLETVSPIVPIEERYTLRAGKRRVNRYVAHERTYRFRNAMGQQIELCFRVSNDGVAFRYRFPERDAAPREILEELTTFDFPDSARAWLQPLAEPKSGWRQTNPSYEEYYLQDIPVGTPSPTGAGWVFPALFRVGAHWVLLTEADVDSTFCGARLRAEAPGGAYQIGYPDAREAIPGQGYLPRSPLPWQTPWRVLVVGDLKTLVESTLGTDLAAPAIALDTTFVRPGRASWSWGLLKDSSITYEVQHRFIDYAAKMGWEYTLIDVNWDSTIGYDRLAELARYAATQGVGLWLWYNASGDWNTTTYRPKSRLLTREDRQREFARLAAMGIRGVKVDFFGGDGRSMIRYYHEILQDAAAYRLMVNFHGCTLPRGWVRTYPHLMTMEAVRGFEFVTFTQADADREANHAAMLPFTRNVFDPMDYTPLSLSGVPGILRKTTQGFQLALTVLFTSGVQHFVETPEGMAHVPEAVQRFLRTVPVAWEETRFVAGWPGKFVILARKDADGRWYVAGINGEAQEKVLEFTLSFLEGSPAGALFIDAPQRDLLLHVPLRYERVQHLTLPPHGGFVIVWEPQVTSADELRPER